MEDRFHWHTADCIRQNIFGVRVNDAAYVTESLIDLGVDVPLDVASGSVGINGGCIGDIVIHEVVRGRYESWRTVAGQDELRRIVG